VRDDDHADLRDVERNDLDRHSFLDGRNRGNSLHHDSVFLALQQRSERRRRARSFAHSDVEPIGGVEALLLREVEVAVLALQLPAEADPDVVSGICRGCDADQSRECDSTDRSRARERELHARHDVLPGVTAAMSGVDVPPCDPVMRDAEIGTAAPIANGKGLPAISHRADMGVPRTTAAQLTASTDIAKSISDRLHSVKAASAGAPSGALSRDLDKRKGKALDSSRPLAEDISSGVAWRKSRQLSSIWADCHRSPT
jgi:hypothetical protein